MKTLNSFLALCWNNPRVTFFVLASAALAASIGFSNEIMTKFFYGAVFAVSFIFVTRNEKVAGNALMDAFGIVIKFLWNQFGKLLTFIVNVMVGGKGLLLALFIDGVTLAVVGYYIGGDEGYSMAVIGTMMFIFSVILHLLAQRKS